MTVSYKIGFYSSLQYPILDYQSFIKLILHKISRKFMKNNLPVKLGLNFEVKSYVGNE